MVRNESTMKKLQSHHTEYYIKKDFGSELLSDKDVVSQYFPAKKYEFDEISKNLTPMSLIESPFRLWGWVIPSAIEDEYKLNGVYTFLAQYMKKHSSYKLRSSTLSAFA